MDQIKEDLKQYAPERHRAFTPRMEKAITLANKVSAELGHSYIGTEHMLLALFRMPDGTGKQILIASGAIEEKAREALELIYNPHKHFEDEISALKAQIRAMEEKHGSD